MDQPSQTHDPSKLAERLKEDAQRLAPSPDDALVPLQERTLQAIRKEFPAKPAGVIEFRPNRILLIAAAATIVLLASLAIYRPDPDPPLPQPAPGTEALPEGIQTLADLTSPTIPFEVMGPMVTQPLTDELDAMVKEFEATLAGLLDLVHPT